MLGSKLSNLNANHLVKSAELSTLKAKQALFTWPHGRDQSFQPPL
jgi:hypothetical protein